MPAYIMEDFLARSTDRVFRDTTLASVLADLPPLSFYGPWIAGGAVRRTIRGQEPDSDFDFFFANEAQLLNFAGHLDAMGLAKVRETEHHIHYRGIVANGLRDIQLIRFAFYATMFNVIDSFDYTICQTAFDGVTLTVGDYTLWDLGRKRLAVNKITYPVSSMRRLLKYASQGYTACNGALHALSVATRDNPELDTETKYID